MKNLFILILALAVQSCSFNSFDQHVEYRVDPLLKPYVDKFYEEAEKRGRYLDRTNLIASLQFHLAKEGGKNGKFHTNGDQKMITVDFDYYDIYESSSNAFRIEVIVFHELGHSIGRKHNKKSNSIMNTECLLCNDYNKYRTEIIDELFIKNL